jgi:hypothetical protein
MISQIIYIWCFNLNTFAPDKCLISWQRISIAPQRPEIVLIGMHYQQIRPLYFPGAGAKAQDSKKRK